MVRWAWPVAEHTFQRGWEPPAHEFAAGHRGVDLPISPGEPVHAPADGTVSFAGPVAGRPLVVMEHGEGLRSTLDAIDPLVHNGDAVHRGEVIGRARGEHCGAPRPCLHVGARIGDQYVDPTPYLRSLAWPVLLPDGETTSAATG